VRRFVLFLALVAGLRVLLFAAAFPPFDNIDEEPHFDLVCKYAHGEIPGKGLERYAPESSRIIALGRSTQFLLPPDPAGAEATPRWKLPEPQRSREVAAHFERWSGRLNHESQSPPVYYAVAGVWYDLGRLFGIRGVALVYWIRFLNAPLLALTVWLAHRFVVRHFPDRPVLHLAVPWLLAFLPQDVFYSINSDVLLAPLALGALDLALVAAAQERRSLGLHAAVGLLVAAAFLTKYTNVVVVALAAGVLVFAKRRPDARELAVAAGAAALPVALWFGRTLLLGGDATGAGGKIEALGWTAKPLARVLDHPILSPAGGWTFLSELVRTSWRGEFVWHGQRVASAFADSFYVGSSLVLACLGAIALLRGTRRAAEIVCCASPLLSVLLLAGLSMAFDFGASRYPSKDSPYFTSGRLVLGSLVPFLALYAAGIEQLFPPRARTLGTWAILATIAAIAVVSEVAVTADVFASPWNAFHLGS